MLSATSTVYLIEALVSFIPEWSATRAGLPGWVIEPGVLFVPDAVTLNSPEPGVVLECCNSDVPL